MKILSVPQIRQADKFTILNEPISSFQLMERAAFAIFENGMADFDTNAHFHLFCGPGNNGGDALVVARLLHNCSVNVTVWLVDDSIVPSLDRQLSLQTLKKNTTCKIHSVNSISDIEIDESSDKLVVIDALFGSGLNRNLSGIWVDVIKKMNDLNGFKVSIDIPSGLYADSVNTSNDIIFKADLTYSLQFPKLSFMFSESAPFVGQWKVVSIGLHPDFISQLSADNQYVTPDLIKQLIKHRNVFSHKGSFGHALLIAGSYGMIGAAVMASKSCMRSGVGLLTTHIPKCGYSILQTTVPEALVDVDYDEFVFSEIDVNTMARYDAIAIGCGISNNPKSALALKSVIDNSVKPLILDADALNIISENKSWLSLLPENSILTPHPKEFERLTEKVSNSKDRLELLRCFAVKYKLVVVLKGANSAIANPDGTVFFNSTGNSGLATAGSGDVLTGIILGFLAQGYSPFNAAVLGVFIHGFSADLIVEKSQSQESLVASDVINGLGCAFNAINKF